MRIPTLFALALLPAQALHATLVTFEYTDTWNIDRTTHLWGTRTIQTLADTATVSNLSLPFYNGTDDLLGVKIIYSAPVEGFSDTTAAALSVSTGTSHFSSASLKAQTGIGSCALYNGLLGINASTALLFRDNGFLKTVTDSKGAFNLSNSSTVSFSTARDYTATILDTTDPAIVSYFKQSGSFHFELNSTVAGSFTRVAGDPGTVTFNVAGKDTGSVEVVYEIDPPSDLVPEPNSIFALGFLVLLSIGGYIREKIKMRRRETNSRCDRPLFSKV